MVLRMNQQHVHGHVVATGLTGQELGLLVMGLQANLARLLERLAGALDVALARLRDRLHGQAARLAGRCHNPKRDELHAFLFSHVLLLSYPRGRTYLSNARGHAAARRKSS